MDVTKKRKRTLGNEQGKRENAKWEQNRERVMELLIGLGFRLGFVLISHFSVASTCSPLPYRFHLMKPLQGG